jgi:Rap1a immunity proteins
MKRVISLILLAVMFFAVPAKASNPTANDLYALRSEDKAQYEMFVCGFYLGLISGSRSANDTIPAGVTAQQISDIVSKYMDAHPEKRHLDIKEFICEAIVAAFPSQQAKVSQ